MRSSVVLMALLCAGCASQAPTEKPAPAPAAPAPASPAAAAAPAAAAQTADAATDDKDSLQKSATLAGYHVIERNGLKFYCTDRPALGTRIKSRDTCIPENQFLRQQEDAKNEMRAKQGQHSFQQ